MSYKKNLFHKAFSLIELLIVVVIMGVVYTLAITNFAKIDENQTVLSLQNLKKYLMNIEHENNVRLLCLDDCESCELYADGELVEGYEDTFNGFLDDSIKVYTYNFNLGTTEISKQIHFNIEGIEEDICFSYLMDKKGVGEQVLVEFKNKVYDFSTYFVKTPVYDSIEEAADAKEELIQEVFK